MSARAFSTGKGWVVAAAVLGLIAATLVAATASEDRAGAATATGAARGSTVVTKSVGVSQVNERTRYEVFCPGRRYPLGGGFRADPGPLQGGEGIYPNSYERLGRQGGYHITAALIDLGGSPTRSQQITLQVACVKDKPGKVTPPHRTTFVSVGQTKTLTMNCKGKRRLIGGGYQRTTFVSQGGDRILESRAISSKAWRVTARGEGWGGGELTGIAYCVRSKKPLARIVQATVDIPGGEAGWATTPGCPKGRVLGFVGFGSPVASGELVYMGSSLDPDGTSTARAFNTASPNGPAAKLTAYGYCLKA